MFIGWTSLNTAIVFPVLTVNSSSVPTASTTTPGFRVYGNAGLMTNGTGSLTNRDTGNITGATNASPIVVTSSSHGLTTGVRVTVSGVGGNTAANGTFVVTVLSSGTFSLDGSTGNGPYTSGGSWTVAGLYSCSVTPTAANGYSQGSFYDVLVHATVSGNVVEQMFRFGVA
jgi:hypothetical protein